MLAPAVRLRVVDVDHQVLCVLRAYLGRRRHERELFRLGAAHHDQAVAEAELGVLDAAALALHLQAQLEAERLAQPVDRTAGILIVERRRNARPAWRSRFHGLYLRWIKLMFARLV